MDNIKLIGLLETLLGKSYTLRNGESAFKCPFCNHHKHKLQINLEKSKWHCWVCNEGGNKLHYLLKQVNASNNIISEILSMVGEVRNTKSTSIDEESVKLPQEFKPLYYKSTNIIYRHAMSYIKKRGISIDDIIKYGIGYCDDGVYKNRMIIPSYDHTGILNYFVARDIFPDSKMKYKNPPVSRNIIPFELFVSWKHPIVLCEGVFDAIAIKRNAIPLLGKFPSNKLIIKIIENGVTDIYIALDEDAKDDALKLSQFMMGYGKNVYLVDMNTKDPSDLGFRKFWKQIETTKQTTFSDVIRRRLN